MIKELKLKNFRRHEDRTIAFDAGLVVLRGANENGKTTIIEGMAYALFGASACRESLQHVVTRGKKESELKTELTFEAEGKDYHLARSKSGAQLTFDGGTVTGQTEVTRYVEKLLGVSAKMATSLWLVSQQSIRGSIGEGSKATSTLIEGLADFNALDELVEKMRDAWTTGSTKSIEERLAKLKDETLPFPVPVNPDLSVQIKQLQVQADEVFNQRDELLNQYRALQKKNEKVLAAHSELPEVESRSNHKTAQFQQAQEEFDAHEMTPKAMFDPSALERLLERREEYREEAKQEKKREEVYNKLQALPDARDTNWEGSLTDFESSHREQTELVRALTEKVAKQKEDLSAARARKITETYCGLCGKDLQEVPEVAVKNAETGKEIERLQAAIETDMQKILEARSDLQAYELIEHLAQKYDLVWEVGQQWMARDDSRIPCHLRWKGEVPGQGRVIPDLSAMINKQEEIRDQAKSYEQKTELLSERIEQAKKAAELAAKVASEQATMANGAEQVLERMAEITVQMNELGSEADKAKEQREKLGFELGQQQSAFDHATSQLARHTAQVKEAEAELAAVQFHNVILKKVRGARPQVVDRLWSVVLAAVSHYFSQIRGTPSVVRREDGNFLVDDAPIEGLSGSTLDILGLAIRFALIKTFVPRCGFVVLDEPGAACDEEREGLLIGTIATSGFDQTLLITHSDLADSFANQLVEI